MRFRQVGRLAVALMVVSTLGSCARPDPVDWSKRDEIPPEQLSSVMDAHYRGLGAMERYEYPEGAKAFREVLAKAPGWIPGTINLAIALLNQGGEADAKAKAAGQSELSGAPKLNIDESQSLLESVIARQPENPWAHYSRGIILAYKGDLVEAHKNYQKVVEIDPGDSNAWLELGTTLTDGDKMGIFPGSKLLPEQMADYAKAVELNPNLVPAVYKLSRVKAFVGDRAEQVRLTDLYRKIYIRNDPAAPGEPAGLVYGEMGRYATVIDPFPRPKEPKEAPVPPKFEAPSAIDVKLAPGVRWATSADFTGPLAVVGRARARFGQGVAAFDLDGDGKLDLYLTSAVAGPKGVRDILLLNKGGGKFEDVTLSWGLPEDRAGLGVAAGDFDADRRLDLFLTGVGDNRLYRNLGGRFEDVTKAAGMAGGPPAVSPSARWLDLDQDGDLDLYVLNYAGASEADRCFGDGPTPGGLPNSAFRNDGKPAAVGVRPEDNWAPVGAATPDLPATAGLSIAFSQSFPSREILGAGQGPHTALAALDVDEDRDIDLVVAADGEPSTVILNDRTGVFRAESLADFKPDGPISGLLVTDFDKDGRPDLVAVTKGARASAWRNASTRSGKGARLAWDVHPIDARGWRAAQALDLDLDTWPDLVGLPSGDDPLIGLSWSRNAGVRFGDQAPAGRP